MEKISDNIEEANRQLHKCHTKRDECARCGKIIQIDDEYIEGEIYAEESPESDVIGYYKLCMPCFDEMEYECVGF